MLRAQAYPRGSDLELELNYCRHVCLGVAAGMGKGTKTPSGEVVTLRTRLVRFNWVEIEYVSITPEPPARYGHTGDCMDIDSIELTS